MDQQEESSLDLDMLKFTLSQKSSNIGPRLGNLSFPGRSTISTPNYAANTSRGIVPHVAHDMMRKNMPVESVYIGLEDFLEKSSRNGLPILNAPVTETTGALYSFTSLPENVLSILGTRRIPPVPTPANNTNSAISILTSVGFQQLSASDYLSHAKKLRPDITIAIADLVSNAAIPGRKRLEKSVDRTHAWLRDATTDLEVTKRRQGDVNLFAHILPYEGTQQSLYLQDLSEEFKENISGLALSSASTIEEIPEDLNSLPRFLIKNITSPHELLDAVSLGVDLMTLPFINESSDAGLAFTFEFGGSAPADVSAQPLADDLWSTEYTTAVSPFAPGCECYSCRRHHRAYLHHLLQAKEMLAWTLLQVHNHATITRFFQSIRTSIANGTFEDDVTAFKRRYEPEMPEKTGQGPRIRGYQFKSVGGGENKKNEKAYGRLDDQVQKLAEAESGIPTPTDDSQELQKSGFAEKVDSL